jgi:2-keto-4-pentenoate hydratase/2-oxohepta-3-ene-1,7-dioic acid hydratase in catechol pathway
MNIVVGSVCYTPQRIFCIGRNYREHVRELANEIPRRPVIFLKPALCLVPAGEKIHRPTHGTEFHYEAELVVLIGKEGNARHAADAPSFIAGISLGLDLTMRDVQKELIQEGLPWEICKSFEQSAPLGSFVSYDTALDLQQIEFQCLVNGRLKQHGRVRDMIFDIETLIVELSKVWRMRPGDLIYTGTPSGIGPLQPGDHITVQSEAIGSFTWEIIP